MLFLGPKPQPNEQSEKNKNIMSNSVQPTDITISPSAYVKDAPRNPYSFSKPPYSFSEQNAWP